MTTNVAMLDSDQAETAKRLLETALKTKGLSRSELRAALMRGVECALYSGPHPAHWGNEADRAVHAAGRLLLRFAGDFHIPVSGVVGPTALGIAEELLG